MHWFAPSERGLALGIRQTAIPLGGLIVALTLPVIAGREEPRRRSSSSLPRAPPARSSERSSFAVARDVDDVEAESVAPTLRDGGSGASVSSGLYLYAQVAIIGFGVLFLHDEHGLSEQDAALVFAASQVLAAALGSVSAAGRTGRTPRRPLRRVGLAIAAAMRVTALLAGGPLWALVPVLAVGGGLSMAWNGLSFTTAAELAGAARSGAAIGFQQTVLSATRGRRSRAFRGDGFEGLVGDCVRSSQRSSRSSDDSGCGRSPGTRLSSCGSSTGSTSCTRSAAARARTVPHGSAAEDDAHRARGRPGSQEAGLEVEVDRHGNLFGRSRRGADVWVGSHLDTRSAGRALRRRARGRRGDRGGRARRSRLRRRVSRGGGRAASGAARSSPPAVRCRRPSSSCTSSRDRFSPLRTPRSAS